MTALIVFPKFNYAYGATMIFKLRSNLPLLPVIERLGDKHAAHEQVIEHLVDVATLSQSDFIAAALSLGQSGSVKSIKPYWLINAVKVTGEANALASLKCRSDVEYVFEDYPVELIAPVELQEASPADVGHEIGLDIIAAPQVWAMGLDGNGSLVCNFDTGVDGFHPALAAKFRGNNGGDRDACWFDPYYQRETPSDLQGHGTHTMGIMVGSEGPDTVGVAPGAQWIAASVLGGGGFERTISDILEAFQWAADPDGDPSTLDDVPDVINNSWGIPIGFYPPCDFTFWEAIDNLEAAGTVVIFGCGNEGPFAETVRTPADRISSAYNSFSVGALSVNHDSLAIAEFSSRGPSGCDHTTIKPEVTAPGVAIRSSHLNGGYIVLSGTSMAAPHVAGAVALLRQFNTHATPDEIKQALMNSATDMGITGEDNDYGWGVINIRRAIELLPTPTAAGELIRPRDFELVSNYPNPFNGSTVISVDSPLPGTNLIEIYDISGRLIKHISYEGHSAVWNGADDHGVGVSSGIYFARLKNNSANPRKMILLK